MRDFERFLRHFLHSLHVVRGVLLAMGLGEGRLAEGESLAVEGESAQRLARAGAGQIGALRNDASKLIGRQRLGGIPRPARHECLLAQQSVGLRVYVLLEE